MAIYEWTGVLEGKKGEGYCLVMKDKTGNIGKKITFERGKEALETLKQYEKSYKDGGFSDTYVSKLRMNAMEGTQLTHWNKLGDKSIVAGGIGASPLFDNIPDISDAEPTILELPFPLPPMILPKKAAHKLERVVDLEELTRD